MDNPLSLLIVQNLQTSKEFYVNTFGVVVTEEYDDSLKFLIGSHQVLMFQGTKYALGYEHGFHASSTLVFTVKDLDKKIEELTLNGVEFIHKVPNQNRWGRYAAFKDPSGIVHELMELSL